MGAYRPIVKSGANALPSPEIDRTLAAERLRIAIARKGWKGADLARKLGKSRQLVASWMRGQALPTGAALVDLPGLLGVDARWLFPKGDKTDATAPGSPQEGRSPQGGSDAPSTGSQPGGRKPGAAVTGGSEIAEPDGSLIEALAMIGKAVGAAVRRVVEKDMLENTEKARRSLAENLRRFALELQHGGVDATELFDVAQQISDGRLLR